MILNIITKWGMECECTYHDPNSQPNHEAALTPPLVDRYEQDLTSKAFIADGNGQRRIPSLKPKVLFRKSV